MLKRVWLFSLLICINFIHSGGVTISNEVIGKKVGELGIIIGLISGRWLMPRGSITRDQLSALLLGYVGNAADILGKLILSL